MKPAIFPPQLVTMVNGMRFGFLLLAPLFLLGACEPISEDQCRSGDWAGLGLRDGKAGRLASTIDEYGQICGALGITPARESYLAARTEGLKTYCTPQTAYNLGRNGRNMTPVCPSEAVTSMLPAFRHGETYHEIAQIIDELKEEISDLQRALGGLSDMADPVQAAEFSRIKRRINRIDDRVFDLERDQRRYRRWP